MELHQIKYFVAVAEEENLTRAADVLGVRPPSLSQQIKALERRVGAELFVRSAAGMRLTAAGRALLPEAKAALAALRRGQQAVIAAAGDPLLSLGLPPGVPVELAVRIASSVRAAGARVEFQDLTTSAQLPLLRRGVLDAGVLSLPLTPQETEALVVTMVFDQELGVLMPRGHRLAACEAVAWDDLEGTELLWPGWESAPGFLNAVLVTCHRNGWHPQLRTAAARRAVTLAELVPGADVVALRPGPEPGLLWRALRRDGPRLRLALAFPRDSRHAALSRLAVDLAR